MHIQGVKEGDGGVYKCTIELIDQPISLEHKLHVLVPPRVYPSPPDGNYVVRAGNDVDLTCHAEGSPRPNITWTRKYGRLPSGEERAETPVLKIPNVDRFDDGEYVCIADNKVGKPATATLNLQVMCKQH